MKAYQTKANKLIGSSYVKIRKETSIIFNIIKRKTKRKPYIRSVYFKKEKVFFDFFWVHLNQKRHKERIKRLKYFGCAIELIKNSHNNPLTEVNRNKKSEILHRFAGLTKNKELFYVQIKENKRSKRKYFMSCFPGK